MIEDKKHPPSYISYALHFWQIWTNMINLLSRKIKNESNEIEPGYTLELQYNMVQNNMEADITQGVWVYVIQI